MRCMVVRDLCSKESLDGSSGVLTSVRLVYLVHRDMADNTAFCTARAVYYSSFHLLLATRCILDGYMLTRLRTPQTQDHAGFTLEIASERG